MSHENYLNRRNQFIRSFERLLARVKPSIISWLGEEQASRFMRDARQEYETLIPRIPYIGESSLALTFSFRQPAILQCTGRFRDKIEPSEMSGA